MFLISADSATEACSAALLERDQAGQCRVLAAQYEIAPRGHGQRLPQMIDDVLQQAGCTRQTLDAAAVSCGPGAFTGIRIGMAYLQGLSSALQIPLIPVSSLRAMAWQAAREFSVARVIAAIDARMGEVYWAECEVSGTEITLLQPECLTAPDAVVPVSDPASVIGVGSGMALAALKAEALANTVSDYYPHASAVGELALQIPDISQFPPEQAEPLYLRNQVAQKPSRSRVIV